MNFIDIDLVFSCHVTFWAVIEVFVNERHSLFLLFLCATQKKDSTIGHMWYSFNSLWFYLNLFNNFTLSIYNMINRWKLLNIIWIKNIKIIAGFTDLQLSKICVIKYNIKSVLSGFITINLFSISLVLEKTSPAIIHQCFSPFSYPVPPHLIFLILSCLLHLLMAYLYYLYVIFVFFLSPSSSSLGWTIELYNIAYNINTRSNWPGFGL